MAQEDKQELILSRHEADRATYSKLIEMVKTVFQDPNARLPFIPDFYHNRKTMEEQVNFLDTTIPKVFQARGEEFCLETCNNSTNDCLTTCKEFTEKAFDIGNALYLGLHKQYTYSQFKVEQED